MTVVFARACRSPIGRPFFVALIQLMIRPNSASRAETLAAVQSQVIGLVAVRQRRAHNNIAQRTCMNGLLARLEWKILGLRRRSWIPAQNRENVAPPRYHSIPEAQYPAE